MPGLKIAACYSLFPHLLGFCGPKRKSKALLNYLLGKRVSEKKIRKILKSFKGAYPYYRLIAKANKISDPFDEKVVKAYWIGNELLEKVKVENLGKMIAEEFSKPGLLKKETALKKAKKIPKNAKPCHNFHVFILGSVSGRINLRGRLLDLCRIGWGQVSKNQKAKIKNKIIVQYQPIIRKNKILKLGRPIKKEIFWDKKLGQKLKIGDWVSIHWNHLIEKLNKKDLENLRKYTKITLNSLNAK